MNGKDKAFMKKWTYAFLISALAIALAGCGSDDSGTTPDGNSDAINNGKSDELGSQKMCAAIRGNGQLITAHFGSLARIVEHYGPLHAVSGGSSASITSFVVSSIQANPNLGDCAEKSCTFEERSNRQALLLKSFQGYLEFLANTEEALAVRALVPVAQAIQAEGIEATLENDPEAAAEALTTILESDEFITLINPELIQLLQESPDPEYHVRDIIAAVQGFGQFDATDPMILVRPGVVSFVELADRISLAASFYAGYGPYDAQAAGAFLDACADASRGLHWSEIRELDAGGVSCGDQFYGLLGAYRSAFEEGDFMSRGDDPVGTYMPALISTSVLTGDAVTAWEEARDQYTSAQDVEFSTHFDDVRFGYFGDSETTARIDEVTRQRDDLKSQKALSLGAATWREALSYSPAEPGLARALELPSGDVSAGGWSDLAPVLVLKDIGCDKVVYVTRTGERSNFAQGVASLLGMTAGDEDALYSLENTESSFAQSLREADAVWCTDWDRQDALDIEAVITDSYNAPMQTNDKYFLGEGAYENVVANSGRVGCTVPE